MLPVGDVVSATMLLQRQGTHLGWPIMASVAALRWSPARSHGRRALVDLPGRTRRWTWPRSPAWRWSAARHPRSGWIPLRRILAASLVLLATMPALLVAWLLGARGQPSVEDPRGQAAGGGRAGGADRQRGPPAAGARRPQRPFGRAPVARRTAPLRALAAIARAVRAGRLRAGAPVARRARRARRQPARRLFGVGPAEQACVSWCARPENRRRPRLPALQPGDRSRPRAPMDARVRAAHQLPGTGADDGQGPRVPPVQVSPRGASWSSACRSPCTTRTAASPACWAPTCYLQRLTDILRTQRISAHGARLRVRRQRRAGRQLRRRPAVRCWRGAGPAAHAGRQRQRGHPRQLRALQACAPAAGRTAWPWTPACAACRSATIRC
jgi:hypothetical protein